MVTEYKQEPYEATQTVYKTEWKDEKFTAYRCELVPEVHTRDVTYLKSVPVTRDVTVTKYECVPTVEERHITRYECVPTVEERQIVRYECVPTIENRQVTPTSPSPYRLRKWCLAASMSAVPTYVKKLPAAVAAKVAGTVCLADCSSTEAVAVAARVNVNPPAPQRP